jgi:hypothetical protein
MSFPDPTRDRVDAEARRPQAGDILLAGADDLGRHVMEDVEVAREARRIVRRVQQDAAREVTLLRSVGRQNG